MSFAASLVAGALLSAVPGGDPGASEAAAGGAVQALRDRLTAPLREVFDPASDLAGLPEPRARSLVALLATRLDRARRLSDDRRWRAVMGWGSPFETPLTWSAAALDESPARYPVASGRENPRRDLVASVVLAWTDPGFSCRFPLRARFLRDLDLVPAPLPFDQRLCEGFERWADLDRLDGVELVFATPSFGSAAASAGHVFLRFRPKPGPAVPSRDHERTLGHGVDLRDPDLRDGFAWRGTFGDYRARLLEGPYQRAWLEYGVSEERDLVVYDLRLTEDERRLLLAELWSQRELESRVSYYFFSVNCARLTYDALRAAVPSLPRLTRWYLHPHEVSAVLLREGRLTPRGRVPSRRSRAAAAEEARDALAPRLAAVPGFDALHASRHAPEPARLRALDLFAGAFDPSPLTPGEASDLAAWTDATLDIETHALDVAVSNDAAAPDLGGEGSRTLPDESRTSPLLDRALDLRAQLPIREDPEPRLEPFGRVDVFAGTSRRPAAAAGADLSGLALVRTRFALVDESPGERRAVRLREGTRTAVLATDLRATFTPRLGSAAPVLAVDHLRVTLFDHASFGRGVRTTDGPLGARLGAAFGLHTDRRFALSEVAGGRLPRSGVTSGTAHAAALLTVLSGADLSRWLVVGAEARLTALRDREGYDLRAGPGLLLDAGAPLASTPHRLSFRARLTDLLSLLARPSAFAPTLETDLHLRLDLLLSPRLGLEAGPYLLFRRGLPTGDAAEAGLAVGL